MWLAQVHATGETRERTRKNLALRAQSLNAKLRAQGLPACEWVLLTSWDGVKTVVATHNLGGRNPFLEGSRVSGKSAFAILRGTVARIGVLDKWPSFRKGEAWELRRYSGDKGGKLLDYLGHFTLADAKVRFAAAADEAEARWGVRPIDGEHSPSVIALGEWIEILKRHHS